MLIKNFHDLQCRFNDYVNSYRDGSGNLHPMLQLKFDHSRRVAFEAREIAVDLGWNEPDTLMAEIIGLLHDVGRFSQYQEFRTYFDPKSVNHGCRGFQVLSNSDWLAGLSSAENHLILESVRLHNRHQLPEDMSADLRRFVHLVRDADKLDIFFVLNRAIEEETLKDNPEIIWNLPRDIPPSQAILDDLQNCRQARYENVKSQADFCLLQLCWIYDLNYVSTIRKVADREVVDQIASALPFRDGLEEAIQHLKQFMQKAVLA